MKKNHLKLEVKGSVSLDNLQTTFGAFVALVRELTEDVNPDSKLEWFVADLKGGSAVLEACPFTESAEDETTTEEVVRRYNEFGAILGRGAWDEIPLAKVKYAHALTSVINGYIPRIILSGGDETHEVAERAPVDAGDTASTIKHSGLRTALRGRIVVASDKPNLYFTLAEEWTGRQVRCYPGQEWRDVIGDSWKSGAVVIVEGTLSQRDEKRLSLLDITDIVGLPKPMKGRWRDAIGCAPASKNAKDSVSIVRRMRNATD